jgi:hypothetical protein
MPVLVIPIRLDDCQIPLRLKQYKVFDLFGGEFEQQYQKLVLQLKEGGKRQIAAREEHKRREIRKIERITNFMSFVLNIRDRIENRPVLLRTKLRVFILCPTQDIEIGKRILAQLRSHGWIDARLSGQRTGTAIEWEDKVKGIIKSTDVMLLCLSADSMSQEGFRQPGFADPWRKAKEKRNGKIQFIPIRLDDFVPHPDFQMWRWLDHFPSHGPAHLLAALDVIARDLGVIRFSSPAAKPRTDSDVAIPVPQKPEFVRFTLPADGHPYWIAKQPVTCGLFERFLRAPDYGKAVYWQGFAKYDAKCEYTGEWDTLKMEWLDLFLKGDKTKQLPDHWVDSNFRLARPAEYVRCISWYEANAFCKWLTVHWRETPELASLQGEIGTELSFRLPLRTEWVHAVKEGKTQPPGDYPAGKTPPGVIYVPSRFQEWFLNLHNAEYVYFSRYCGEMFVDEYLADMARMGYDHSAQPWDTSDVNVFRLMAVVSEK